MFGIDRFGRFAGWAAFILVCFIHARPASAAEPELTGTWNGTYDCGTAGASDLSIEVTKRGETIEGVLEFKIGQQPGSLKVKGRAGAGGRVAFLPDSWIEQPPGAKSINLFGTLSEDGKTIAGTVGGCGAKSSFALTREIAPTKAAVAQKSPVTPDPVGGGALQGHWKGFVTCRSNRRVPESYAIDANVVQEDDRIGGLFHVYIFKNYGANSGDTIEQTIVLRGTVSGEGVTLLGPIYLNGRTSLPFKGMKGTLDQSGTSLTGVPSMSGCQTIALSKIGAPVTHGFPEAWIGLWTVTSGSTRTTMAFVPNAELHFAEIRSSYPINRPLAKQDQLVAALVPLEVRDGRIVLIRAGTRSATGLFDMNRRSPAHHILSGMQALILSTRDTDAIDVFVINRDNDAIRAFAVGSNARIDRNRGDFSLKRGAPQTAQVMAAGATPPLALTGGLGGKLAESPTLEEQCKRLSSWAKPFIGNADLNHMEVEASFGMVLGAFADDVFTPVFGVPYPLLTKDERKIIHSLLREQCGSALGMRELTYYVLTEPFETDFSQKRMTARLDARRTAVAWLDQKRKQIAGLADENGSVDLLAKIEKQSQTFLKNFPPRQKADFHTLVATRSATIEGAPLRRAMAALADRPDTRDTLADLVLLMNKMSRSHALADVKQAVASQAGAKARTIAENIYATARQQAAGVPHSLQGLATVHRIHIDMARIAGTMRDNFSFDSNGALQPIMALESGLLAEPQIQSDFRQTMMALKTTGDPYDAVREAAAKYIDVQHLGKTTQPFLAYTKSVQEASLQVEMQSIDFQDISGNGSDGEPTAREIFLLVHQRLDDVNKSIKAREQKCIARNFQNDPVLAMGCIQLMTVTNGQGGFRTRLKSFSKLGCTPQGSAKQFRCHFETALANNSQMFTGELGRMFSAPGVQDALFIRTANGGWTMIYGKSNQ